MKHQIKDSPGYQTTEYSWIKWYHESTSQTRLLKVTCKTVHDKLCIESPLESHLPPSKPGRHPNARCHWALAMIHRHPNHKSPNPTGRPKTKGRGVVSLIYLLSCLKTVKPVDSEGKQQAPFIKIYRFTNCEPEFRQDPKCTHIPVAVWPPSQDASGK